MPNPSSRLGRPQVLAFVATGALVCAAGQAGAQDRVELEFWDMMWGPPVYTETAERVVEEFNASQDEIHVTYRSVPWSNWYETYITAIASGSAPDLSTGAGFQAVQLYDLGAIMPVDSLVAQMEADGTIADFAPGVMDTAWYDGHYVGLPWSIDLRALFYRKDILEEAGIAPPTTWAELREAAAAVTDEDTYGLVSSGDASGLHWILAATINNGGGLFDAEGNPAINGERSREALEFLAGFAADGSLMPASVGYTNDEAIGAFGRGEAAFLLSGPNMAERVPEEQRENIGVLPPIAGPHGDTGTIYWVAHVMVYNQTEHPEEALEFLRWWSDNQEPVWSEGHASLFPARNSHLDTDYFRGNENVSFVIEHYLPVAKGMGAQAGGTFPELNQIDGDGFLMSTIQQIWQGSDPGPLADEAQAYLEGVMNGE